MFRKSIHRSLPVFLLALVLLHAGAVWGESDLRKVKSRVEPTYPELARRIHMAGTVRIEIVVAPNGTVKAARAIGGHPLLVQSAEEAVRKWRYEPGPDTSTMVVEFHFQPN